MKDCMRFCDFIFGCCLEDKCIKLVRKNPLFVSCSLVVYCGLTSLFIMSRTYLIDKDVKQRFVGIMTYMICLYIEKIDFLKEKYAI